MSVNEIGFDLEACRVAELLRYRILDTECEPCFDHLVAKAAETCDTPIALMSLVDDRRQWFKASVGISARETPRSEAFCVYALKESTDITIVNDATQNDRFCNNPLVTGPMGIRFYAGMPLIVASGYAIGTLCVIDRVPRDLTLGQRAALRALARAIVRFVERRRMTKIWN